MVFVKTYKAGKSLRVTVPKAYLVAFAMLSEQAGGGPVPRLLFYATYRDQSKGTVEPYFTNCDFGLKLYVGQDRAYCSDLRRYGKTSVGFTIGQELVQRLAIVENTKLECQILDNTRPREGFYSKIIGYTRFVH